MKNKNLLIGLLIIVLIIALFVYKSTQNEKEDIILDNLVNTEKTENVSTVPNSPTQATSIKTKIQSNSYVNKDGYYVVQYTDSGFVPKTLQIPKGKAVKFINMSNNGMRIFTTDTSSIFTQLNQAGTVRRGEVYTLSLPNAGLWDFHNQSYPSHSASILVY